MNDLVDKISDLMQRSSHIDSNVHFEDSRFISCSLIFHTGEVAIEYTSEAAWRVYDYLTNRHKLYPDNPELVTFQHYEQYKLERGEWFTYSL